MIQRKNMGQMPHWAIIASKELESSNESLAAPVSSKEKNWVQPRYGYNCKHCQWIFLKEEHMNIVQAPIMENWQYHEDLEEFGYTRYMHKRCKPCANAKARWRRAKEVFVALDEQRMNAEIPNLKFVTKTRPKWTIEVPFDNNWMEERRSLKTKSLKAANNWRQRNDWWAEKEIIGQYWPECVVTIYPLKSIVKLHFHIHMIIVSPYLDNKPIPVWGLDQKGKIVEQTFDDSEFFKEWKGVIDIRRVKDYQNEYTYKGEKRRGCGRKACMRYLTKYISKADGWSSRKIGDW